MTTVTLNVTNKNMLESLKYVLSNIVGVEIADVREQTDNVDATEYILSSPAMVDIIAKGDKEIAEGKGTVVNVDDLWK